MGKEKGDESMRELSIFDYKGKQVRTIQKDGETWWVLKDVCAVLGISDVRRVAERLDVDEWSQTPVSDRLGRSQDTYIINESGLYNVILRSDKAEAKPFRKWVTGEVLPSIRKTGGYGRQDEALLKLTEHVGKLTEMVIGLYEDKRKEERTVPRQAKQLALDGTEERELCGVTELLNRFDLAYGAAEFNAMMREKGYMEKRKYNRLWEKGEREIDILTEKGLPYGQNCKHVRSSRGAQPKYYADCFLVFYKKVTEE